jgi:cystathionine beta-lyase/cystathionine gamma-synthase
VTSFDTTAVHAGREDLTTLGVHAAPLDLSTTYPLGSVDGGGETYDILARGGRPQHGQGHVYQRLWSANVGRLETAMASLEGVDDAVAFASGMAALTACVLATVMAGRPHVVAVRPLYGGTDHLLASGLLNTTVTYTDARGVGAAVRPDTGLVVVETPANPTLDLVDIDAIYAAAPHVPMLVDNTFATPVLQRPARHGAALVVHSAAKYIGGHSDAMGGMVAADVNWAARLRQIRAVTGGILSPATAYLLHRGVQTLPVRLRAQQATAVEVVRALTVHPNVDRLYYPGLPGGDPQRLIGRQMAGPGAVFAFQVRSGEMARRLVEKLSMITHAVSLGSTDTLIQHPASLTHRMVASDAKPDERILRVSVGLESAADILYDLDFALHRAS